MSDTNSSFEGKYFLITGVTGGLGPAVADRLVRSGGKVEGVYHSEKSLEKAKERTEESLTKSLNEELERVRVNALAPETMDTPANRKAMPDADREEWTSPSKVAEVVEFLLSSKSSSIGGQIITV